MLGRMAQVTCLVACLGCSRKPVAAPVAAHADEHLRLTLQVDPSRFQVTNIARVAQVLPQPAQVRGPSWRVGVMDGSRKLLAAVNLEAPNLALSGVTGPDGGRFQAVVPLGNATFSVVLPMVTDAKRVVLWADPSTLAPGDPRLARALEEGRVEVGEAPFPPSVIR